MNVNGEIYRTLGAETQNMSPILCYTRHATLFQKVLDIMRYLIDIKKSFLLKTDKEELVTTLIRLMLEVVNGHG